MKPLLMMFLAVLVVAAPASAATFTLTQISSVGAVTMSGSIRISDAAYASGLALSQTHVTAPVDWSAQGIEALAFSASAPDVVSGRPPRTLAPQLADLVPLAEPGRGVPFPAYWSLVLTSAPGATPTGSFRYVTTESDMYLTFNGAATTGGFNTDAPVVDCRVNGVCRIAGVFALDQTPAPGTTVPEPVSGVLLAAGVLAYVTRRRLIAE